MMYKAACVSLAAFKHRSSDTLKGARTAGFAACFLVKCRFGIMANSQHRCICIQGALGVGPHYPTINGCCLKALRVTFVSRVSREEVTVIFCCFAFNLL